MASSNCFQSALVWILSIIFVIFVISDVTIATMETDSSVDADGQPAAAAAVSKCGSCWSREAKRSHDIELIKTNILKKLRLRTAPNITVPQRPPSVPTIQQFLDNEDMVNDAPWTVDEPTELPVNVEDGGEVDGLSMMRIVHFNLPENDEQNLLEFRLQRQLGKSDIKSAHIGIYVKRRVTTTWTLSTYSVTSSSNADRQLIVSNTMTPKQQATPGGHWLRVNVTRLVEQWVRNPRMPQKVLVETSPSSVLSSIVMHPHTTDNEYIYRPYLEVHIREQTSSGRSRRTASLNCDELGVEKRCCRYPLIVDFASFDWNWIIAPKRYAAFYCSGECPFLYFTTYLHGSVAQRQNELNGSSAGPCCAPVKTSNISMLYYNDEGNVMLSVLPDMVVDQCGCS